MGTITNTETSGKITTTYHVDGVTAVNHDAKVYAVLTVGVVLWGADGEVDIELYGVPLTKTGKPDRRRTPQWIIPTDPAVVPAILADLGIDAGAGAVIGTITATIAAQAGTGDDR